ncbi:MAG: GxxExxY protein [Candidatus Levybacteria bacterium]|nr:GxxExxY protein [Candidatus Levybacteria bacterium]MBI3069740.1 GxxExxY protein [Candidatus Levybacteria bacterium]
MAQLIYPELSYKITGLCFKIHHKLGRFCREKQYSDSLEEALKHANVVFEREFEIKKLTNDSPYGNRVDFLIENKIILDIKAKKFITKEDYIQMQRYLHGANLELGLIVNFRSSYLKPKRVLNGDYLENSNN